MAQRKIKARVSGVGSIVTRGQRLAATVLGITLFVVPLAVPGILTASDLVQKFHMVFECRWVILFPLVVVVVSACFGAFALFGIGSAADHLRIAERATSAELVETEDLFGRIDAMLRHCLTLLSVMVAFSVICTATLRTAFLEMYPDTDAFSLVPIEFVHAYGLFFTAFLAILYLPVQFLVNTKGQQLYKDMQSAMAFLPPPAVPPQPTGKAYVNEGTDAWGRFKLALAILGPFLSSILPDALKGALG